MTSNLRRFVLVRDPIRPLGVCMEHSKIGPWVPVEDVEQLTRERDEARDEAERMQVTRDAEIRRLRAALENADGCFEAALAEGWLDALAKGDIDRIRDIWQRRIQMARAALSDDSSAPETSPEPAGEPTPPDLWNAVSHLLSHWDEHRKCFELCGTTMTELRAAFAASAAPGHPSPPETSTDGWRCITCSYENPKGVLRCQNSKCTALSYSAKKAPDDWRGKVAHDPTQCGPCGVEWNEIQARIAQNGKGDV